MSNSRDVVIEFDDVSEESDRLLPITEDDPLANHVEPAQAAASKWTKHILNYLFAALAAAPSAINALAGPSGQSPEKIGTEWWSAMSAFTKVYSLASGVSSMAINIFMNALFLPVCLQKLSASLKDMRNGWQYIALGVSGLILAFGAGIAAGALSWNSFLWLPLSALASIPTITGFAITAAARFISIKTIFSRIGNIFNANARLQKELAVKLEHINDQYLGEVNVKTKHIINQLFPDKQDQPLTDEEYESVIVQLARQLDALETTLTSEGNSLFNNATTTKAVIKYAGLICDILIALTTLSPAYAAFTQKGFDGVNILSKITSGHTLDDLQTGAKAAIGLVPGVASGIFYANAGFDFRSTMTDLIRHLYHNPASIPAAIALLAANGLASNSMTNVAQGIIDKPDNIFAFDHGPYGNAFKATLTIGGAVVNTKASTTKVFLSPPAPNAEDITFADITKQMRNTDDHRISTETVNQLRTLGLFSRPAPAQQYTPVQSANIPPDVVINL